MTGNQLVVRVRSDDVVGVTEQDVDPATAVDAAFTGSQATGSDPARR